MRRPKGNVDGWPSTPADNPARVAQWARRVLRHMEEQGRSENDRDSFAAHYDINRHMTYNRPPTNGIDSGADAPGEQP